jgi:hypothetical protein
MDREEEGRDGILEKEGKGEEYSATRQCIPEYQFSKSPEAVPSGRSQDAP